MKTLTFNPPSTYHINSAKSFKGNIKINKKDLLQAFDFAYQMCFGAGHHRNHRTGGRLSRRNGEKFSNTFQGKLAEIVLYNSFTSNGVKCSEVDLRIMGEREWDDSDFIVNGKCLNVKSAAYFSNLLLLEQDDWDQNGNYIPNLENDGTCSYDFFVLIRIKPDIKKILKRNRLFYADTADREVLLKLIADEDWSCDIPGFITHQEWVAQVIGANHILPQNALLNGNVRMDASNYYVQSGDLHPIDEIINLLMSLSSSRTSLCRTVSIT